MSIAKSFLESEARNVDGTRRSLSEASFPNLLSPSDFPKLRLNPNPIPIPIPNPNPRRRGRSLSEASNRNLLSPSEDVSDYPNPKLLSPSDFLSEAEDLADYPNLLSESDFLDLFDFPEPIPKSLSEILSEDYRSDYRNLRRRKRGPNPLEWPTEEELEELKKIWPTENEKELEQKEEIKDEAEQLFLSDASVTPNTTKEELVHSSTTTKEELLSPPTSQDEESDPWQSMLGCSEAEWRAELRSTGNICQACGCTDHWTVTCSYFKEIPPDAKIFNETLFEIACANCSMFLVDGACFNRCFPPLRRKIIKRPVGCLPKKELFAPPSSEMVVHSSSEETTTPSIHGLSTSSSLKLNGELHARATTPPFAFPDVPSCIHGLSSSSSLKFNGELTARATTKTFAFPDLPALHSRATNPPL